MPDQLDVAVGDEVVHPQHGPGTVTATETVDLGAGPVPYVVVKLNDGMIVKLPAASLADVGLREPITEERAEEVLTVLSSEPSEDPGHRPRRRRDNDKLASGKLMDCAEVVRDLTAITAAHPKGGTTADLEMLRRAREQLAAELSVVLGVDELEALTRIDEAIRR